MKLAAEFFDNVGPLADALANANVDIYTFLDGTALGDTSHEQWHAIVVQWVSENPELGSVDSRFFTIIFALGYLQATANHLNVPAGTLLRELFPDL
jgi:hypothetical protein